MNNQKIFPIILIILDICAALMYAKDYNFKMMIYWFAAAILTICVTI